MALAATQQNLVILDTLPRFRGNLRQGEDPQGTSHMDVRTFLRSLEIQFGCRNITDNNQKVQLLFNQVVKNVGDAIDVVNAFAGINITYESLKEELLISYPQHERTDFTYAAHTIMNFNIQPQEPLSSMSQLEAKARAAVEAFMAGTHREKEGMFSQNIISECYRTTDEESGLPPPSLSNEEEPSSSGTEGGLGQQGKGTTSTTSTSPTSSAGTTSSSGTTSTTTTTSTATTSTSSTTGTQRTTSETTEAVRSRRGLRQKVVYSQGDTQTPREFITAQELLHSFIMHLHLADKLEPEVYKEIAKTPIGLRSTMLKAKAARAMEKHFSDKKKRANRKNRTEVLYEIRPDNNVGPKNETKECFRCGKRGHLRRDCRVSQAVQGGRVNTYCKYCKTKGHDAKRCEKRVERGIPYCNTCDKIGHESKQCKSDRTCSYCNRRGHTFNECRVRKTTEKNNGNPQRNRFQGTREAMRNLEEWDNPNDDSETDDSDVLNILWEDPGEIVPEGEQTDAIDEALGDEGKN